MMTAFRINNIRNAALFHAVRVICQREKKGQFRKRFILYEKENIEIVLTGVQLKKKYIDFQAMSDKILTRKIIN